MVTHVPLIGLFCTKLRFGIIQKFSLLTTCPMQLSDFLWCTFIPFFTDQNLVKWAGVSLPCYWEKHVWPQVTWIEHFVSSVSFIILYPLFVVFQLKIYKLWLVWSRSPIFHMFTKYKNWFIFQHFDSFDQYKNSLYMIWFQLIKIKLNTLSFALNLQPFYSFIFYIFCFPFYGNILILIAKSILT